MNRRQCVYARVQSSARLVVGSLKVLMVPRGKHKKKTLTFSTLRDVPSKKKKKSCEQATILHRELCTVYCVTLKSFHVFLFSSIDYVGQQEAKENARNALKSK